MYVPFPLFLCMLCSPATLEGRFKPFRSLTSFLFRRAAGHMCAEKFWRAQSSLFSWDLSVFCDVFFCCEVCHCESAMRFVHHVFWQRNREYLLPVHSSVPLRENMSAEHEPKGDNEQRRGHGTGPEYDDGIHSLIEKMHGALSFRVAYEDCPL